MFFWVLDILETFFLLFENLDSNVMIISYWFSKKRFSFYFFINLSNFLFILPNRTVPHMLTHLDETGFDF